MQNQLLLFQIERVAYSMVRPVIGRPESHAGDLIGATDEVLLPHMVSARLGGVVDLDTSRLDLQAFLGANGKRRHADVTTRVLRRHSGGLWLLCPARKGGVCLEQDPNT